jgi:integrase
MKLIERSRATDSRPFVYVGRRVHRTNGSSRAGTVWWAEWCHRGRSHGRTLRTSDKSDALRAARALAGQFATPVVAPVHPPAQSLKSVGQGYIDYQVNRGHAPRTVEKYTLVLKTLNAWARRRGLVAAPELDENGYWAFHRWMLDEGFSHKTRYDRLIVVKQMFKWAARTGLIPTNPLAAVDLIRKPAPTPQPCFTPEQVGELLFRAAAEDKPVIALMAYAGLRFGEVRDLRWSDLGFNRGAAGFIHVMRGGSGETTKSGRPRQIPMHPTLREILLRVPRRSERVFLCRWRQPGRAAWRPLVERTVLMSLKRLCRACGFEGAERFKLHSLRHAFCSMCARNNVSYKYALVWLGHRDSQMLDYYYHAFDETAEAAIRTINYPTPDVARETLDFSI